MSHKYTLSPTERRLIERPDAAMCVAAFAASCAMSREHIRLLGDALTVYGDHGCSISAIGRDHFPEPLKTALRMMARDVTTLVATAYHLKPRGMHASTMRAIGRAVAKRDGTGFYGVQA